jgi:hypothetical protein
MFTLEEVGLTAIGATKMLLVWDFFSNETPPVCAYYCEMPELFNTVFEHGCYEDAPGKAISIDTFYFRIWVNLYTQEIFEFDITLKDEKRTEICHH